MEKFIIIDDDPFNNQICTLVIKSIFGNSEINAFSEAENGLKFIKELSSDDKKAVLLLDINMPSMSGWEFLDKFSTFDEGIKNRISVFILSSSVDQNDIEMANKNKYVAGFISKPLSKQILLDSISKMN